MALPTPPSYNERIPNDPFYWPGAESYAYTNAGPVQINVAGSGISIDYSSSILYATGGGGGGAVSVVFPITNAGTPIAPIIGIAPATTTTQGSVELATVAETDARLSTTVAVTPASLINYFSSNIFTQRGQLLTSLAASSPTLLNPPVGIPAGCVLVTDPLTPSGLNWSSTAGAFIPCACILAKGSILTGPAAATPTALPVGVDGSVLVADSTTALGLRWDLAAGAFIPCACIIAKGTLISGAVANVPQPLAVGLDNYVLTADSTCALGLKWAPAAAPPATPLTLGTVYGCTTTTLSGNTALGHEAFNNSTGRGNAVVGRDTLSGSSSDYTVAVGVCSLQFGVTGDGNTGVGAFSLTSVSSGCYNTGIGNAALSNITTGIYNTGLGYDAGRNQCTGSYSVALGTGIFLPVDDLGCQLAIGWRTGASTNNYWLTGCPTKAIKPGAGIVDCAGSCGTAGQVLMSNGANAVCWGSAAGAAATPTTLGTVYGATCVAVASGASAHNSTAIGHSALNNYATVYYNTAVGVCAGQSITGTANTVVGFRAMEDATNASYNVAVGCGALCALNTGSYNTTVGSYSLRNLTSGNYNTSLGGVNLFNLATGNCNLALGGSALGTLTSGNRNIGIGYGAPTSTATISNEVNIYNGVVTARFQGAAAAWTFVSDERDKTDIEPLPLGLEFVKALEPRKFKWNIRSSEVDKGKESSGFVAQEVLSVVENFNASYTNLVDTNDPEQYTFAQANLVPMLVNAVKELAARVEALENK